MARLDRSPGQPRTNDILAGGDARCRRSHESQTDEMKKDGESPRPCLPAHDEHRRAARVAPLLRFRRGASAARTETVLKPGRWNDEQRREEEAEQGIQP